MAENKQTSHKYKYFVCYRVFHCDVDATRRSEHIVHRIIDVDEPIINDEDLDSMAKEFETSYNMTAEILSFSELTFHKDIPDGS